MIGVLSVIGMRVREATRLDNGKVLIVGGPSCKTVSLNVGAPFCTRDSVAPWS